MMSVTVPKLRNSAVNLGDSEVLYRHANGVLSKDNPYCHFRGIAIQEPDANGCNELAHQIDPPHRAVEFLSIDIEVVRDHNDPISFNRHGIGDKGKLLKAC